MRSIFHLIGLAVACCEPLAVPMVRATNAETLILAQAQSNEPIGLKAALSRATGVYAIGETLGLTITAEKDIEIEIWELTPSGQLNKVLPRPNARLEVKAGVPLTLPLPGMNFKVTPPIGTTELRIIAKAGASSLRNIGSAQSGLAGRSQREEVAVRYKVVNQ